MLVSQLFFGVLLLVQLRVEAEVVVVYDQFDDLAHDTPTSLPGHNAGD
jgi:hypothetical protein